MNALILALLSVGVVAAQTPPPAKSSPKTAPATTAPAKTGAAPGAATKAAPRPSAPYPTLLTPGPAGLKAKAPDLYRVKFTTTKGDFVIEITREWAPLGADRFYNLVRNRFFTDASFFRVVPNFVVQFGMSAFPAVNKVWGDANIKDEPVKGSNKKGVVTFAKTDNPNTRSTQLFINLKDNPNLDATGFSPIGTVSEGMEVVSGLYSGYGDNGPDQGRITMEGKPYLDKNFPKLDSIKSAVVIFPEAPPPAPKKAAPAGTPAGGAAAPAVKKSVPPPPPVKK